MDGAPDAEVDIANMRVQPRAHVIPVTLRESRVANALQDAGLAFNASVVGCSDSQASYDTLWAVARLLHHLLYQQSISSVRKHSPQAATGREKLTDAGLQLLASALSSIHAFINGWKSACTAQARKELCVRHRLWL